MEFLRSVSLVILVMVVFSFSSSSSSSSFSIYGDNLDREVDGLAFLSNHGDEKNKQNDEKSRNENKSLPDSEAIYFVAVDGDADDADDVLNAARRRRSTSSSSASVAGISGVGSQVSSSFSGAATSKRSRSWRRFLRRRVKDERSTNVIDADDAADAVADAADNAIEEEPASNRADIDADDVAANATVDCGVVCPEQNSLKIPDCGETRVEPDFHRSCGCITRYHCCPHICPPADESKCRKGLEFPVRVKDCCSCVNIRCDACPEAATPTCNPGCETIEMEEDKSTGCNYPVCRKVCPNHSGPRSCPECFMATSVSNSSLCGCQTTDCVRGACPPVTPLEPRECVAIKTITNSCGCQVQSYDADGFCRKRNSEAAAFRCEDPCFKAVVLKGQGRCGCDKAECERIDDRCRETFDATVGCPVGTRRRTGTTPCGVRRDVCLHCDAIDDAAFDDVACNRKCHEVVNASDADGCPTRMCRKKTCEKVLRLKDCGPCQLLDTSIDFCGCVVAKCVVKCPKMTPKKCKAGFLMGVDSCGCPSGTCVPGKSLASAMCSNKGLSKCKPLKRFADCGPCEILDTTDDGRGCPVAKCVKKCKRVDVKNCNQGFRMKTDGCGCSTGVCVPGKPLDQLFRSAIKHSVYRETSESWYLIVKITQSFYLAQSFCRALPLADLASVESPEEFNYLQKELKSISNTYYWIGGHRVPRLGWIWSSTGQPVTWFKWHPSNAARRVDHAMAWHPSNQGWTDMRKASDYFFVCESLKK